MTYKLSVEDASEFLVDHMAAIGYEPFNEYGFQEYHSWQDGAYISCHARFRRKTTGETIRVEFTAYSENLVEGDYDEFLGYHHEEYIDHKVDLTKDIIIGK